MPPLKAQLLLEESLSAYFPEMVFTGVVLLKSTRLRCLVAKPFSGQLSSEY